MARITPPELVVIGTSLGGLNALIAVLGSLPPSIAVPLCVVQHRSPDIAGQGLATLLQEHTRLTVIEAEDKMPLSPGTVFLAPADYHLLVEERGRLALSTEGPVRAARPAIDVLFETAAEAYGPAVLGVLLTGASADGAEGIATLKRRGARVIVQDPESAESPTMPAAGIAAASVDYVVALGDIGRYVTSMVEGTRV